ncbi:MAG TPA: hypothetical protein VJO16_13250 [Candidatus Acidoferrum sp.]|nr:hypothetical protein [Candidatus Acidoferrum sp.]
MHSAQRSFRAVAFLVVANLTGTMAFAQAVNFLRNADPLPLTYMASANATCRIESVNTVTAAEVTAPCDTTPALVSVPTVNPCNASKPGQGGCELPADLVKKDLASMGKTGQKILRARDRVLEILQTENACSEWLQQKDLNAAATFRTLKFTLDRHGEEAVRASKNADSQYDYRDPYVASVGQATGAYATVTLNMEGAFFQAMAPVLLVSREGGPARGSGARLINIGPYAGDSVPAQTLALLHEFGHVIDLLPSDFENEDGKSVQNTAEVLRYCRAEIDAKGHRSALQAAK